MVDLVSLDDARAQCRLSADMRDEDGLIEDYIAAARRACAAMTGFNLSPSALIPITEEDAAVVRHAMLVMIAHWFDNRGGSDMPKQATWLLNTIRRRRL